MVCLIYVYNVRINFSVFFFFQVMVLNVHRYHNFIRLIRDEEKGGGGMAGLCGKKAQYIPIVAILSPQNDSCIKMGRDESQFNVSLIVSDKVTRQCPQTTTFQEKGERKRIRTEVPLLTRPNQLSHQPLNRSKHVGHWASPAQSGTLVRVWHWRSCEPHCTTIAATLFIRRHTSAANYCIIWTRVCTEGDRATVTLRTRCSARSLGNNEEVGNN